MIEGVKLLREYGSPELVEGIWSVRVKEIVRLRVMMGLREMIELLENDLEKLEVAK